MKLGYMKAYGMYAGVMALFALFAIGLYFKGKAVRNWTMRSIETRVFEYDIWRMDATRNRR
jgi:hypothetical protein